MKTRKTVICALFAALTFVATWVIKIPMGTGGFVNIGDCMVIISGIFLGPVYGALAAGIGSCLVDVVSGYMLYAPATLIIKAIMAISVAFLYRSLKSKSPLAASAACSALAEIIMIIGYYLFDVILMKSFISALAGMPGNLLQAAFGFICSIILYKVLSSNKYIMNQINL